MDPEGENYLECAMITIPTAVQNISLSLQNTNLFLDIHKKGKNGGLLAVVQKNLAPKSRNTTKTSSSSYANDLGSILAHFRIVFLEFSGLLQK